jgi:hypothetical protein
MAGWRSATRANYALRLQEGLKAEAGRVARQQGTTLNQFINTAVAEKLSALRASWVPISIIRAVLI